jgi:hypothetical protein
MRWAFQDALRITVREPSNRKTTIRGRTNCIRSERRHILERIERAVDENHIATARWQPRNTDPGSTMPLRAHRLQVFKWIDRIDTPEHDPSAFEACQYTKPLLE